MKVKDIMTKKVVTLKASDLVVDALTTFKKHKITGAPVVDDFNLIGIVTESDILKFVELKDLANDLILPAPFDFFGAVLEMKGEMQVVKEHFERTRKGTVDTVMTKDVVKIEPDAHVSQAAHLMTENKINRLVVVEDGGLVGIVTRSDLLKALS